jgi:TonB family protein
VAVAQDVKQAGVDVPAPKRTRFVAPAYPPEAQASGQRGIVILELVVGVLGKVESVSVVRSVPPFDEAAVAAVRQWEYEVTRVDGRAVPVRLTVPITFALKLPTVTRAAGVPELRMGAAPAPPPEPWGRREATVEADVTIDADGLVTDALITAGDSPWAEALLQALRTWRFVGAGEALSFRVRSRFAAGGQGQARVDLELTNPRRVEAAPAAPEPAAPAAATAVSPSVPASPPEATPHAPAATTPPVSAPPPASPTTHLPPAASPASAPSPTRGDAVTHATPAAGTSPQAPAVEVVPAAPPPPPPPEGGGGSAVRGIQLGTGVPDLVSGRRPVVPPLARLNAVSGKVHVRFAMDASGATSNVEAEGDEPLREAARQAVSSWIFRRTRADRLHLTAEFDYGTDAATVIVSLEAAK